MAHEAEAVAQHLRELAGAAIGATAIWFFAVPLLVEIFGSGEAIPGWFWAGLVIGLVVSTILTMTARRIAQVRPHQRA